VKGDPFIAFIASRGVLFWSKAYIITSEVADEVVEVAKAMPVNRSIKAIPNKSHWFLVILIERFTLFVKKHTSHEKIEKLLYPFIHSNFREAS
jgi:hypothetical protein